MYNYIAPKGHPEDDGEYLSSRQGCPEGAFRAQAGVKPLLTNDRFNSPDGATECSATPSGFGICDTIYRGFTPACSLFRSSCVPLVASATLRDVERGLTCET